MKQIKVYSIEELLEKASEYIKENENINLIKKAYEFAEEKHLGQKRKSGEDMTGFLNVLKSLPAE